MSEFDPRIVAFCCDQSGAIASEMAAALKLQLPRNVEYVRIPCAGRVETIYLMKALEKGADGVMIFACHKGNCQFLHGNIRAKSRLSYAHGKLEKIGLEKERLEICHLATNSGVRFAEALRSKAEELKRLGPNPVKTK